MVIFSILYIYILNNKIFKRKKTMKKYLSHFSAAIYWNVQSIDRLIGKANLNKYLANEIKDITITEHKNSYRTKNYNIHTCSINLPRGSIKKTIDGQLVASPELTFLQLAHELNIQQTIFLGLQMCSSPAGDNNKSITTKSKLITFVNKMVGHRGRNKAIIALKYVINNSASPMESLGFMILTLPHYLGGFGLSGACFNQEVTLDYEGKKLLNKKRCFIDIFYKKANLAIEYDSMKYHSRPEEQAKDMIRATVLKRHGIEVVRFGSAQIANKLECRSFAYDIAKRLGKRIQIRTTKFEHANKIIRYIK